MIEESTLLPDGAIELLPQSLYIVSNGDYSGWLKFNFYIWVAQDEEGTVFVSHLIGGQGPAGGSEGLRECRHTYWGDSGYLFYPNKKQIIACLEWLSQYFDME